MSIIFNTENEVLNMYEWQEIINEFLIDIKIRAYSDQTIYNYKIKLKNIEDFFESENIKIDEISKKDIKMWIAHMLTEDKQASTINATINRLSKLLSYMVEEEYIEKNVLSGFKRLRAQKKIIYPLNDYEIRQLITVCKHHKYKHIAQRNTVMFMMMLECGLRISEVANLKNTDILENQIVIRNSKNNKDRALAITPILKKEMLKYNRIKNNKYKDGECEYYFISSLNCGMNPKSIFSIMKRMKEDMDIREVVRFSGHTLRHTYAHMAIRNGMDIYTLSMNMGHGTITMTQNYLQTLKSDDFVKKSVQYSTLKNLR